MDSTGGLVEGDYIQPLEDRDISQLEALPLLHEGGVAAATDQGRTCWTDRYCTTGSRVKPQEGKEGLSLRSLLFLNTDFKPAVMSESSATDVTHTLLWTGVSSVVLLLHTLSG